MDPRQQLAALFRETPVLDLAALQEATAGRSRRSLFRDLKALDYLASYSHAGRYYALRRACPFDADGLWRHGAVGFSVYGTLKATVQHLVTAAADGRTHDELRARLGLRVHNTLLDLLRGGRLHRDTVAGQYLYLAADPDRARAQLEGRCQRQAAEASAAPPAPEVVIAVLLEVLRQADLAADPHAIAVRLTARGLAIGEAQVEAVLEAHAVKKTAGRPSPSSPT